MPDTYQHDKLPSEPYRLLSCRDVAAILGVHPSSVRRLRARGRLPAPDYARGSGGVVLWFARTMRPWIEARQKARDARRAAL